MSDINQINEENASLERSLLSIKDEQVRAEETETEWNDKISAFNASIKPLQDQFKQKLQAYMNISNEYYTKYIPAAAEQQRIRLEKYAQEMFKFMNYPVYYARLKNETSMKQSEWDSANNNLDTQYNNAMIEYNKQKDALDEIIAKREAEAEAGIIASETRRQEYQQKHSPNYMAKLQDVHKKRVYWLEYWRPVGGGRLGNGPKVLRGYLRGYLPKIGGTGGGDIKRAFVIDGPYPQRGLTGKECLVDSDGNRGSLTPGTVWGSAAKRGRVWGGAIPFYKSEKYTNYTLSSVPKIISYPLGPWNSNTFGGPAPQWGGDPRGWRIYMKTVWIDPSKLNNGNKMARVFGQADDRANLFINGKQVNSNYFRGGWGNTKNNLKLDFNKQDYFYPGSNFILIQAENTGGPGGITMGICDVYNDGPHWDDILVNTNETWWAFETNVENDKVDTKHKGTWSGGVSGGRPWLQDANWVNRLHDDLRTKGWMGKVEGAEGVSIHNYQPPEAKVRYVRVDFAQRPSEPIIQIAQLAVYPTDNMEVNIAKGKSATAKSTYPWSDPSPSKAVDGTLETKMFPYIYHSDSTTNWQDQYWEVDLGSGNAKEIYKIVYYNRKDCCQQRCYQTRLRLFDENRNLVFSGPPFGSTAPEQSFFFNHPITTSGLPENMKVPVKSDMDVPRPVFSPDEKPSHPVMTPWKTPNKELLDKVMKAGDELLVANQAIQARYKIFATQNNSADMYQGNVLQQRKELLAGVLSLIKERNALGEEIQDYTKLSTNQANLEKGAVSNQIYSWIWMCIAVLSIILFFIFLVWPNYIQHSVPIISWTIIIMGTLLTTIFIGGNIAFLLWIFILVSIFFWIVKHKYGGRV